MKKLIVLVVLLALAAPAWAVTSVYPEDGTGGTSIYPAPSTGGGSAKITNIADWTLATGIESDGPYILLSNTVTDDFDDASLDAAIWNSVTTDTGTVTEEGGYVLMNSPVSTDAAFLYYLREVDRTESATYTFNTQYVSAVSFNSLFMLWGTANAGEHPQATASGGANRIIQIGVDALNNLTITRYTEGAAFRYWSPGVSGWTSVNTASFTSAPQTVYTITFTMDSSGWMVVIYQGATHKATAAASWATTYDEGGAEWLMFGKPFTDGWNQNVKMTTATFKKDTATTSPVAQTGDIDVGGATITQLSFNEEVSSGCSLTYDHTSDGSTTAGDTLSQMRTAVVGTAPTTFSIDVNMNGNGSCQNRFWLDGSALTE
jgi:hypothetical protein